MLKDARLKGRIPTSTCLLTLVLLSIGGCADNATRLRFDIAEQVGDRAVGDSAEVRVAYLPVKATGKPYWLILFPDRTVSAREIVAAGLDESTTQRVFRDLSYVGVGTHLQIVVVQDGERISFTGPDGFHIPEIMVARRLGRCHVVLRRVAGEWHAVAIE